MMGTYQYALRVGGFMCDVCFVIIYSSPASILYKSIAGRYRPVSYPNGPITARYRFIKNAYWAILPFFGAIKSGIGTQVEVG